MAALSRNGRLVTECNTSYRMPLLTFIQVRELCKAIVASPQRLAQFKELQHDTTPMGLIQDVRTRWNSTFEMLTRALRLQVCIEQWISLPTTENKYSELWLSQQEWAQVQEATIFLKPLSDYTHAISTGQHATIHNAFFIYNDIFDHIEKQRKRIRKLPASTSWAPGFLSATKACRQVFQKYYSRTEKQSLVYNLATILDPSKKLSLYQDWGHLAVKDPSANTMQQNTDCIAYSDYYKYV